MAVAIHLTVNKSYAYRLYCLFYWNTKEKFVNHQALVTLANWKIPPPAEIKWFGEKYGQFYLQQYLLSISDFIKVLLLKAIVKCTTMCVTFCGEITDDLKKKICCHLKQSQWGRYGCVRTTVVPERDKY
jgi:hypothetical protein